MPIARMRSTAPGAARWPGGGFIDRCSARNAEMTFWLRLARRLAIPLLRALPKRHRFGVALRLARLAAPFATRIAAPRIRSLNDGAAIALRTISDVMNRYGI